MRLIWGLLLMGGFALLAQGQNVSATLDLLPQYLHNQGVFGTFLYVGIYFTGTILMVPMVPVTALGGYTWGGLKGGGLSILGATLGASGCLLLGRFFFADFIRQRFGHHPLFPILQKNLEREGFRVVLLFRLTPFIPFTLLNWGSGITAVKVRDFFLATALGISPMTFFVAFTGEFGQQAIKGFGSGAGVPQFPPLLNGLIFLSIIVLLFFIRRFSNKILADLNGPSQPL